MKPVESKVWKKLEGLSGLAPDLSLPGALNHQRIEKMILKAEGWTLSYGTERVNEEILDNLYDLAAEAKVEEKMNRLQRMEVMNYVRNCKSEERMVGHTAIRDLPPSKQLSEAAFTAAKEYETELEKLKSFLLETKAYTSMIVVGIGGSYLGTYAVYHALKAYQKNDKKLYFASNVDPDKVNSILKEVDLKKTLVAIISKSGGTLEISAQEEFLWQHFESQGLNPKGVEIR